MKRTALFPSAVLGALVVTLWGAGCSNPKVMSPGGSSGGDAGGGRGNTRDGAGTGGSFGLPDAGGGSPGASADGGPTTERCAEQAHQAERIPVDLLLLVDTSGSMGQEFAGRPKWGMVNDALMAFLGDPMSAGLGVGLATFPPVEAAKVCNSDSQCGGIGGTGALCTARACVTPGGSPRGSLPCIAGFCLPGSSCVAVGRCSQSGAECADGGRGCPGGPADVCDTAVRTCRLRGDVTCNVQRYAQPLVSIAPLPAGATPLRNALGSVVPGGLTPMQPAVEGSLGHLQGLMAASAGRRAALVLASDGLPEGCDGQSIGAIAGSVAAARAAGIPTYVIGVFAPETLAESQSALAELAMAGGGGPPFILDPNQSLTQRFLDALNQIRGNVLACDFQIPKPPTGTQDFGKVNVRFTGASGTAEDILYVGSPDRCDPVRGGWHYDVLPAAGIPQRIVACPATCERFKSDSRGRVEIRIGCTTRVD
jgi:Mg-chelatase subunit ChlD